MTSVAAGGRLGKAWRTVMQPVRLLTPFGLMIRRVVAGEVWVEVEQEDESSAGPHVEMSDEPGVQSPDEGVGPLHRRCYRVRIEGASMTAAELLEAFRSDPNRFSPTSFAVFVPDPAPRGLIPGSTVEIKLPGPWDGPVLVAETEPLLLRLETRNDHMEAGRIEFSTSESDGVLTFMIDSFATSGDQAFDLLYRKLRIARKFQAEMWARVLEAAVDVSGGRQQGRLEIQTIVFTGGQQ